VVFPKLAEVHRTTFTRQAANLWKVKEKLWQHILRAEFVLEGEDAQSLFMIDSFPIPVCKKSRSYRCKVMKELSGSGRDTNLGKFLGMRAHVLVLWPGVIVRADVCGANVHDLHLAERLLEGMGRGGGLWLTGTTGEPCLANSSTSAREVPSWWLASSRPTRQRKRGIWCGPVGSLLNGRR
jgi:hypothetical protein